MKTLWFLFVRSIIAMAALQCFASGPTFTVDAAHPAGKVSPRLYGLMTEEINHAYDGGLYAELIRNRAFLDDTNQPVHWAVVNEPDLGREQVGARAELTAVRNVGTSELHSVATISLDFNNPYNDQLTSSLRLDVTKATKSEPAGVANSGYWGIPVQARTAYHLMLLARAGTGFKGPVTVSIVDEDGKHVYASQKFSGLAPDWKKFQLVLKTGRCKPTAKARFLITLDQPGTVWFGLVSLMPPTWNDRPNGLRKDLMQMLVDLHPKFLRFPGGNYLEGDTIETRFDWKKTLGPIEQRHGHPCPWGYRSTDGLGLLEFLEWCEDMKAEPVLAVYAGYSLKGEHVKPGSDLKPFVTDALEEIEYVIGDKNTVWGARRAKDGHPLPFELHYVEIGNEDWFDRSLSYDERFAQFQRAIKERYPQLKTISTIGHDQPENLRVHSVEPDMLDEHYYRAADEFARMSPDYARRYPRSGPEIFVGEWAAHEDARIKPWSPGARQQPPTPSMKAALGDALFMAAMERNSDLIKMQCYAPLLVNVNPGARQWRPDLIGYDALSSYGSPSYYAIQLFSCNIGDEILPISASDTSFQGCATLNSKTGEINIKLVNPEANASTLAISINSAAGLASKATVTTLTGNPDDINSISEPKKLRPITRELRNLKPAFEYALPPDSIVLLKLKQRR